MTQPLVRPAVLAVVPASASDRPFPASTAGERLLLAAIVVGFVHHVDHVLRADHSGWPFLPQATPFTISLVAYPLLLAALFARNRPWLRAAFVASVLVATQAAHIVVETPYHQFATWAYGASPDPAFDAMPNLLGVASPALGLVAAGWSILLSGLLAATVVAFVRDARAARR